eukprot:2689891-Pleurochrysis_carterae.AAC.1
MVNICSPWVVKPRSPWMIELRPPFYTANYSLFYGLRGLTISKFSQSCIRVVTVVPWDNIQIRLSGYL